MGFMELVNGRKTERDWYEFLRNIYYEGEPSGRGLDHWRQRPRTPPLVPLGKATVYTQMIEKSVCGCSTPVGALHAMPLPGTPQVVLQDYECQPKMFIHRSPSRGNGSLPG